MSPRQPTVLPGGTSSDASATRHDSGYESPSQDQEASTRRPGTSIPAVTEPVPAQARALGSGVP